MRIGSSAGNIKSKPQSSINERCRNVDQVLTSQKCQKPREIHKLLSADLDIGQTVDCRVINQDIGITVEQQMINGSYEYLTFRINPK